MVRRRSQRQPGRVDLLARSCGQVRMARRPTHRGQKRPVTWPVQGDDTYALLLGGLVGELSLEARSGVPVEIEPWLAIRIPVLRVSESSSVRQREGIVYPGSSHHLIVLTTVKRCNPDPRGRGPIGLDFYVLVALDGTGPSASTKKTAHRQSASREIVSGAGDGDRTRDPLLGKQLADSPRVHDQASAGPLAFDHFGEGRALD
jgi:hypothetical protein